MWTITLRTLATAAPRRLIDRAGTAGIGVCVRARWIVEKLASSFGQPMIVENRADAGGVIGTEAVAKSAPDGYTLLLAHQGVLAINPHIYARPGNGTPPHLAGELFKRMAGIDVTHVLFMGGAQAQAELIAASRTLGRTR